MRNTIEISQGRTIRSVGCISIANIDAAKSGFDLRRGGHYAITDISTMYWKVSRAAVTSGIKKEQPK
jgi:hypothetical protein